MKRSRIWQAIILIAVLLLGYALFGTDDGTSGAPADSSQQ